MKIVNKVIKRVYAALSWALLFASTQVQAEPAMAATSYIWAIAPMGAGGFVDGFIYLPAEKGLMYARTDVGGGILIGDPRDFGRVYIAEPDVVIGLPGTDGAQ